MEHATMGFGPHLTLDLHGCDEEKICSLEFLTALLNELPGLIGMTKIAPPYAFFHPGSAETFDKGGVTGFVPIAESHITIHTFRGYGFAFVDIFSCKPFDIESATAIIKERLGAESVEQHLFDRGKEFPRSLPAVRHIITDEREGIVHTHSPPTIV